MSDWILGRVARVGDKNKWGFYSFKLIDSDTWYGYGKKAPFFKEGAFIKFEAEVNARGFWNVKDGTVLEVDAPKEVVSNGSTAHQVAFGKDSYWQAKEDRDLKNDQLREYGATRNTAIEWVKVLLQHEAVKLPTKTADREAILQALLTDTIKKFGETNTFKFEKTEEEKALMADPTEAAQDQAWN